MSTNYDDYLNGDETFLDHNNQAIISEIKEIFKDKAEVTICAKGPSVRHSNDPNAVGINQGIIFTNKRFMVCNDFEAFFGVEDLLKNIEYIFMPADIHMRVKPNPHFTYKQTIEYLRQFNIKCKFFIYRLHNVGHKYFFPSCSSTDIAWTFFRKFIGISKHNTLGHGDKPTHAYHTDLQYLDFNQGESKSTPFISELRKDYLVTVSKHRCYM